MLYSCTHMATVGFKGLILLLYPDARGTGLIVGDTGSGLANF